MATEFPQWFLRACAAVVSLEVGMLGIVFVARVARNRVATGKFNHAVVKRACWDVLLFPASVCLKWFGRQGDKLSLRVTPSGQVGGYFTRTQ